MSQEFILALDQGTTSSRALVINKRGEIVSVAQKEFRQIFPQPGWVEHDPEEIWSTQIGVAAEAISRAGLTTHDIRAIGITNQRETTVVWDRHSGKPVYNAIVWQDRRTADFCEELKKKNLHVLIQQRTGLVTDAYFSASKIKWILDHVEGAREKAEKGELCFGTIDTWLLWKLTAGKVHATDVSNASRTMLMNLDTLQWDGELQNIFTIPGQILPQIRSSSEVFGYTEGLFTSVKIPVAGIAGDQQSALFGQLCTLPGMVKNTYGTGCFMLMLTGEHKIISRNQLLTTVAWKLNGKTEYALEGSVFIGGAVVQWLRDGLGLIRKSSEVEQLASSVKTSEGVYVVPAFTGLGAPYWNPHARGTIVGLSRGTTAAHIARAALDSIAFQTYDLLKAMEADAGMPVCELRVDGGASVNNALMQFQADILNCRVVRPAVTETTAMGAAFLAGLATGFWKDRTEIESLWQKDQNFDSQMEPEERERYLNDWKRAVRSAQTF